MRILLTGSEGVLGKYIKKYFEERGYDVVGLDIRDTADYVCDIRNTDALVSILHMVKPDIVIHFAALTSPSESVYREIEYYEVNTLGTAKLVRLLNDNTLLIFASSCAVYGDLYRQVRRPIKETDPVKPLSAYGLSKYMAENIIRMHVETTWNEMKKKIDAAVLRFGNIYSPYDDKYVFWKIWTKKIFTVYDPTATRDYVSVHDLAILIEKIIEKWNSGEYKGYSIYNVGHEPYRVQEIVEAFKKQTGKPEKIRVRGQLLDGEFHTMILDIEKTRKTFNWQPKMKLVPDGIKWLAKEFRKRKPDV